jgi:uncharacterized protein YqcC (DUF446 family)
MPKVNRVASASAGKDKNCKVLLERLDPAMLPETQPVKRKNTKETREHRRRACINYRKEISSGINLLKKWVPGTETFSHPEILIETGNYIKTLQNEIKEVTKESLKESKKRVKYMKELEHKENHIKELEQKIKELETWQTPLREPHPSEPEVVLVSDPTGASTSSTMDVRSISEAEWLTLEDVGVFIPAEEFLLESEEELPDFNSMEDFTQWIKL